MKNNHGKEMLRSKWKLLTIYLTITLGLLIKLGLFNLELVIKNKFLHMKIFKDKAVYLWIDDFRDLS